MAAGGAARGGVGSIALAVSVSLLAPVVAYAVVRNAAVGAAGSIADPTTTLPPRSVVPRMKAAMRSARRLQDPAPAGALAIARSAAVAVPLAFEPYYLAARVEEKAGRYGRATRLMEEARRRRPNSTSVRVALLGYYSLADAYQKAIDEADMAMRINGRSIPLILPAFAKLVAADPKARQAIAVSLARKPPWRDAFLDVAATSNMDVKTAKALVADVRRLAPSRTAQAEEAFLVRALVQAGEYREARALWESYRSPAAARAAVVTDGRFAGTPAMAPFGWNFQSGGDGSADIGKAGAGEASKLEVDYFGDTNMVLAEQTLAARPGAYRLSSTLKGEGTAADLQLSWQLLCLPGGRLLATLPLPPFPPGVFRRQAAVTIPAAGCEGQRLALVGEPGDTSRTLRAEISEISLTPVGKAQR